MLFIFAHTCLTFVILLGVARAIEYRINAGRLLLGAAAFAVASYITIPIPIVDSLLAPVLLYGVLIGDNFQDHNRVFKLFILTLLIDVILFFLVFPRVFLTAY